jgi:hypothetical protein
MAIYEIRFSMNNQIHRCTGRSSYPTKENYESGDYFEDILQNNIRQFITLYKRQYGFNENSPYNVINCILHFD